MLNVEGALGDVVKINCDCLYSTSRSCRILDESKEIVTADCKTDVTVQYDTVYYCESLVWGRMEEFQQEIRIKVIAAKLPSKLPNINETPESYILHCNDNVKFDRCKAVLPDLSELLIMEGSMTTSRTYSSYDTK